MSKRVLALGHANVDFVVEKISGYNDYLLENRYPGGAAANTAIAIKTLGLDSGFIGKIGKDGLGKFFLQCIKRKNVNIEQLKVDENALTGFCVVAIAANGQREMFTFTGANSNLKSDEICETYLRNSKLLFISGYTLVEEKEEDAAIKAAKTVCQSGGLVSLDIRNILRVRGIPIDGLPILKFVNILFVQEGAIEDIDDRRPIFFKNPSLQTIVEYSDKLIGYRIITRDKPRPPDDFDSKNKATASNMLGANDTFIAGFLFGYLKNKSLEEAGSCAQKAKNFVASRSIGASLWDNLPTEKDIE